MDDPKELVERRKEMFSAVELLCVFFWFLLDGFWLMEWRVLTYAFSILALGAAGMMFLFINRQRAVVFVTCADTSWLLCNVSWAVGDLAHVPAAIRIAKALFLVGLFFCACAFHSADKRGFLSLVLSRMRIISLFERRLGEK
jgi:hypothetical protein